MTEPSTSAARDTAASGIPGLDLVLRNGFPRNQTYLIQGASGVGKTTFGLQFLLEGARAGERVLHIGTAETTGEIEEIARSHGWSLDGVTLHHHAIGEAQQSALGQTMLHPAEVELPETVASLLSVIDDVKPSRLVIDSLAEIRSLAREESWYRHQLMLLKEYFLERACTVLLIEIPATEQPLIKSIVSGVIRLEQLAQAYGPERRRLRVEKLRARPFVTGYHDYRIRTGGIEVYPRLVAAEHRRRTPERQIGSGLQELDALLGGGVDQGASTLLLGATGTGKSLIATQLIVAAAERGERSAIYVFDERVETLLRRSESVGLPLEKHVEAGTVLVQQVDPAEMTPGEFSHLVHRAVAEHDVRLVVIDSLNGYAYAMPEERFLVLHLHELMSFLSQRSVTTLLVMAQHGVGTFTTQTPFEISYIADTVLLLFHFEHAGSAHKAIMTYKRRSGAHERTVRELRISSSGIGLGEPLRGFRGLLSGTPQFVGGELREGIEGDEATDEGSV